MISRAFNQHLISNIGSGWWWFRIRNQALWGVGQIPMIWHCFTESTILTSNISEKCPFLEERSQLRWETGQVCPYCAGKANMGIHMDTATKHSKDITRVEEPLKAPINR